MQRTFSFQTHHNQFPTLQSIDAQSQIEVDYRQQQTQHLIGKVLMLCLELERKHKIMEELQMEVEHEQLRKSQIDNTHRELNTRYEKLLKEHHFLIQSNAVLKSNIVNMEKMIADLQVHKSRSAYNKQLQDHVNGLQNKLKLAEEQKIEYIERQKNLKRENSMLSYSANKITEKNRIRDLEFQIIQEKNKLEVEKKLTSQLKIQIEKNLSQIRILRENQIISVKKWQQKIQKIEIMRQTQDLKQSQTTAASEQKIVLLSQQLHRLSSEIQYLRSLLKEEKDRVTQRETQLKRLTTQSKLFQEQRRSSQKNLALNQEQGRKREEELVAQIEVLEKSIRNLKVSHGDLELFLKEKTGKEGELSGEMERLREEFQVADNQRNLLKSQMRKMKRKQILTGNGECEICKIRSTGLAIPNNKVNTQKIKQMDLQEIIKQTQKLNASNKKIESLLSHHSMISQQSFELRSSATATIINMSAQS